MFWDAPSHPLATSTPSLAFSAQSRCFPAAAITSRSFLPCHTPPPPFSLSHSVRVRTMLRFPPLLRYREHLPRPAQHPCCALTFPSLPLSFGFHLLPIPPPPSTISHPKQQTPITPYPFSLLSRQLVFFLSLSLPKQSQNTATTLLPQPLSHSRPPCNSSVGHLFFSAIFASRLLLVIALFPTAASLDSPKKKRPPPVLSFPRFAPAFSASPPFRSQHSLLCCCCCAAAQSRLGLQRPPVRPLPPLNPPPARTSTE